MSIYLDSKQDEKENTSEDDPPPLSVQQPAPTADKIQDGVQDHGRTSEQSVIRAHSSHSRGSRRKLARIKKQQVVDKEKERKKLGMMVASLGIDFNILHV